LEIHSSKVAEIEVCIQRFPDKQKRTVESYGRFRKDNLETIKILESRRECPDALRESKDFFGTFSPSQIAGVCAVLAETADQRLAEHALTLRNVRAFAKETSVR